MKCNIIFIHAESKISDEEFSRHIKSCSSCRELQEKVDSAMSLIDLKTPMPENLSASIFARVSEERSRSNPRTTLGMVLQLTSVAAAAVFIGIFLGINSNTFSFPWKDTSREQAINEYREFHHLNINHESQYHLPINSFLN
jgi:predicted anti-sigma-YlaC factor YlaD